jgi:hypothetical protein
MGKEVEGRSEGRVGGENESERKNKVRNDGCTKDVLRLGPPKHILLGSTLEN